MKVKTPKTTQRFDPIEFLEIIGLNETQKVVLRKKLEINISEYILLRLLDELPKKVDQKLKSNKVTNIEDLEKLFKSHIPNFYTKTSELLKEFKKQYKYG